MRDDDFWNRNFHHYPMRDRDFWDDHAQAMEAMAKGNQNMAHVIADGSCEVVAMHSAMVRQSNGRDGKKSAPATAVDSTRMAFRRLGSILR